MNTYRIAECRASLNGLGVVWPVREIYGRCACGSEEMSSEIAFFRERSDAELFIAVKLAANGPNVTAAHTHLSVERPDLAALEAARAQGGAE